MTLETVDLPQLVEDWIKADQILNSHFTVVPRVRSWNGDNDHSVSTHYIAYACPNRVNLWAVVFISNIGTEGYFNREMNKASDPKFFEKLKAELIKSHDNAVSGHSALGNCKELLGERIKTKRR